MRSCDGDTPPSVRCRLCRWSLITLLCVREHQWRNLDWRVPRLQLIVDAPPTDLAALLSFCILRSAPTRPAMLEMDSISETGDQSWIRLEPLKNTHLPEKVTQSSEVLVDSSPKMTANGVHDIEDRILRITGYYGYKPGFSSHRSE